MLVTDEPDVASALTNAFSRFNGSFVLEHARSLPEAGSKLDRVDVVICSRSVLRGVEPAQMIQISRRAAVVIALNKSELLDAKDLVAMADGWLFLDENSNLAPEIAWLSQMQYCIVPHFMKPQFALDQLRVDLIDQLSLREHTLLRELARGRSNRMIAERMGLTESGVSSQIRALLMKLGFQNRTEAAVFAARFTTYLRGEPPQPPEPRHQRG